MRMIQQLPRYTYFCKECKSVFETKHSMKKVCLICEICDKEGCLERQPSTILISKKVSAFEGKSSAGCVVKATIEEAKLELEEEHERLQNRRYNK